MFIIYSAHSCIVIEINGHFHSLLCFRVKDFTDYVSSDKIKLRDGKKRAASLAWYFNFVAKIINCSPLFELFG